MPPVSIDTTAARAAATSLDRVVTTISQLTVAAGALARSASLDEEVVPTRRLFDELGSELDLTRRLLVATVDGASGADRLAARLTKSLNNNVGARPSDLADPRLLASHADPDAGIALGHFGFLPLFGTSGMPSPDDVRQGLIGDCALMAALAAIAQQDPMAIKRMITDHGDGTYTVHLPSGDVRVDDQLPYNDDGTPGPLYAHPSGESGALWPAIVEKAAALATGGGYVDVNGVDAQGNSFSLVAPSVGAEVSLDGIRGGSSASELNVDIDDLADHLDDGLPAVAVDYGTFGFGGAHAWSVVAVNGSGSAATVTLRNPWGRLGLKRNDGSDTDGDGTDDVVYDTPADAEIDGEPVLPGADGELGFGDSESPYLELPADVFLEQFDAVHTAERPANQQRH